MFIALRHLLLTLQGLIMVRDDHLFRKVTIGLLDFDQRELLLMVHIIHESGKIAL
jgi:hypothetical protein